MAAPLPLLARLLLLVAGLGCLAANTSRAEDQKSSPKSDDFDRKVVMTLFTRQNLKNGQRLSVDDPSALKNSSFNSLVKTKICVHGWLSDEKTRKRGGTLLKDALLEMFDLNVILVDWSGVDSINYISSRFHVKRIGEVVAKLAQQLVLTANMSLEDLHLIGHSLGAHIMGFAGRTIGLSQGRITALDPAGPLFWDSPSSRLDKSDAGFVDVIHTCGGYMGYKDPIGHADFYPNGGTWVQPGCGIDIGGCSHCRGYSLLLESIESPGAFIATKCSSWASFKAGKCSRNGTAELGLGCSTQARGTFYLYTNSQPSYSKTSGKAPSALLLSSHNIMAC